MNVYFTNRLDEPAIAQGAGIDRLEAYLMTSCLALANVLARPLAMFPVPMMATFIS